MSARTKRIAIYSSIFIGIFIAMLPVVLTNNYLRQDDLIMWQIWPGMKVSQTGFFYYNTVFQLVRPLCMLSFFVSDLISLTIQHAVYIRLLSVIGLGILGIALYRWQIKYNPNRVLAACFGICAFTLPPYQVFAATQNYSLIILALLMTFAAMLLWHKSFYDKTKMKHFYFWTANLLFFASFLEYPLSSMYAWVLLGIYYLNIAVTSGFRTKIKFFYFGSAVTLGMTLCYYFFIRIFHKIFHVDVTFRSAVIDTNHLISRLMGIFDVMSWHSNMWLWSGITTWKNSPIIFISLLFAIALIQAYKKLNIQSWLLILKKTFFTVAVIFILFCLAYSPIMASPDPQSNFRYAIDTMPLLLYISFWSINEIAIAVKQPRSLRINKFMSSLLFISVTIFGICYANLMLADGIVGPHVNDFEFIEKEINEKVFPLIKQHRPVLLHFIDCNKGINYSFPKKVPDAFEYGMRSCMFQQVPLSIAVHILNLYGYPSNYNRENKIVWNKDELVVSDIPWGYMIINSVSEPHLDQFKFSNNENPTIITIDFRKEPSYQHLQFYKELFGIKY